MSPALPAGWRLCRGDTLFETIRGVTFGRAQLRQADELDACALLRANNLTAAGVSLHELIFVDAALVAPRQHLRPTDVLVTLSSGSAAAIGRTAQLDPALLASRPLSVGAFCAILRPREPWLGAWLHLYFQTAMCRKRLRVLSAGSSIHNLKPQSLAALPVPVPPPDEGQRILRQVAALLAHGDRLRQQVGEVQAACARLSRQLLRDAFDGSLTARWRHANLPGERASDLLARLGVRDRQPSEALPASWCTSALGDLFDISLGGTPSRQTPSYFQGDIPWVTSGEVRFATIAETREKLTLAGLTSAGVRIHPRGTVLLGLIGQGKTRGQAAILDIPAATNQNVAALQVQSTPIPPRYVYYWLMSQYAAHRRLAAGNNQPALSRGRVATLRLPLAPLGEQHEIVARLDALLAQVGGIERRLAAAQETLQTFERAVRLRAVRGQLPVDGAAPQLGSADYAGSSVRSIS